MVLIELRKTRQMRFKAKFSFFLCIEVNSMIFKFIYNLVNAQFVKQNIPTHGLLTLA